MRRICRLVVCTASVATAFILPMPEAGHAGTPDTGAPPTRGIAILASGIGADQSPEDLAQSVRQWGFSPVVIDWAWITAHWDRTDFQAVSRFLDLMAAEGVPVAAMYRPRFLSQPTVPIQTDRTGASATSHGYSICFASPEARQWGISWGTRILEKLPQIDEIIIYNPLNQCQCPACREAAKGNPYARYDSVWSFLAEAKTAWRAQRTEAKLGVVFVSAPEFWRRGGEALDVAHPFLFVTDDTDLAADAAAASAVRDLLPRKMGSCLAKLTWGPDDKVSPARLAQFDRTAAAAGLPYFFWTFETLFASDLYDPEAVAIALGMEQPPAGAILPTRGERGSAAERADRPTAAPSPAGRTSASTAPLSAVTNPPGGFHRGTLTYSPEQVRSTSAEVFLERMLYPEQEYSQFSALNALIQKASEAEPEARDEIMSLLIGAMHDRSRPIYQRWQCCKVIGACGYEQGVPDLVRVLLSNESGTLRAVAAEALEHFPESEAARDALQEHARREADGTTRTEPIPRPDTARTTSESNDLTYTADQTRTMSTGELLERMQRPEPGYRQFAAMNALTQKAKQSSRAIRKGILSRVIAVMHDRSRPVYQRYQCCYVLSGCGDERAVPDLIQVLLHDDSDTMRAVAAEALAKFPESAEAHDALLQAARRESSPEVLEVLTRRLGQEMPTRKPPPPPAVGRPVEELAPMGPPQPPPGPALPVAQPLPWPFPGGQEDQRIFNNYQQATDSYIHAALDFIHPAGTPVTAVDSGYVAAIYTNYPDWITHHCFIVTPERGGKEGWCYVHLDPRTFTFREGEFVHQGERLGTLVDFSVGSRPGVAHLHLHYVRFSREASGKVNVRSLLDPLYFFDWEDTEPPIFQPLRYVTEGTAVEFPADAAGVATVRGRVDVLAAVADSAYPGHMGNLGVPVVMLSISDGTHTMQKLVLDHRGDVGGERHVRPLYLSHDEKKALLDPDSFPRYQMLRVTKTDGDGRISPRDASECWDTSVRNHRGEPLWPNGRYSVNVYAWDIAGNRAVVGTMVEVRN